MEGRKEYKSLKSLNLTLSIPGSHGEVSARGHLCISDQLLRGDREEFLKLELSCIVHFDLFF